MNDEEKPGRPRSAVEPQGTHDGTAREIESAMGGRGEPLDHDLFGHGVEIGEIVALDDERAVLARNSDALLPAAARIALESQAERIVPSDDGLERLLDHLRAHSAADLERQ